MPATLWTEHSQTGAGWQEGVPASDGSDDFYIDFLFEGTGFFATMPWSGTEASGPAASYTEASGPASTWTEHSL